MEQELNEIVPTPKTAEIPRTQLIIQKLREILTDLRVVEWFAKGGGTIVLHHQQSPSGYSGSRVQFLALSRMREDENSRQTFHIIVRDGGVAGNQKVGGSGVFDYKDGNFISQIDSSLIEDSKAFQSISVSLTPEMLRNVTEEYLAFIPYVALPEEQKIEVANLIKAYDHDHTNLLHILSKYYCVSYDKIPGTTTEERRKNIEAANQTLQNIRQHLPQYITILKPRKESYYILKDDSIEIGKPTNIDQVRKEAGYMSGCISELEYNLKQVEYYLDRDMGKLEEEELNAKQYAKQSHAPEAVQEKTLVEKPTEKKSGFERMRDWFNRLTSH